MDNKIGSVKYIDCAIEAVMAARADWAVASNEIYALLGVAERSLRRTRKKAQKELVAQKSVATEEPRP